MRLLLDTHVVLWLLLGERHRVGPVATAALQDSAEGVLLSAVSVWEIAIKRSLGKLSLEDRWLSALHALDLDHLPVTSTHAAAVESLPWLHRDPFDRMLVAQSRVEEATLVTADVAIARYEVATLPVS